MADGGLPATTSASQLVSYSMCPRKYACQYVLGLEPEFTSTALIVGSVVRSGVEWWFGERLLGGSPTIEQGLEVVAVYAAVPEELGYLDLARGFERQSVLERGVGGAFACRLRMRGQRRESDCGEQSAADLVHRGMFQGSF